MTQPATGTTWVDAGFADLSPEFLERGRPLQVLVRDARGTATDISPHNVDGSVRWSPFAQDNKWRADLLARRKVNGQWVTVATENQGLLSCGAFKDGAGPTSKPKIRTDAFRVIQSGFPYGPTTITEESEAFSFTPVDTGSPVVQHLRKNLRLSDASGNIILPDAGQVAEGYSRTAGGENVARQFFICRELAGPGGLPIYKVDGYSLCRSMDFGASKRDNKDSEASELSYEPELDGIMLAMAWNGQGVLEYQPAIMHTWYGGPGRTALGGVPVLSSAAPVATAGGTAGTATLAFAVPSGPGDPWSYKAQVSTDGGTTWGAGVTPASVAVSSGTVTLSLTGRAAGTTKLRGMVTGSNGAVSYTPPSNTITVAGS
jgi:hypothetical protein